MDIRRKALPEFGSSDYIFDLPWLLPLQISTLYAGDRGPSGAEGVSRHKEIAKLAGFLERPVISCHQVHSLKVLVYPKAKAPFLCVGTWVNDKLFYSYVPIKQDEEPEAKGASENGMVRVAGKLDADGILTDMPVLLGVTVADCLPVAFRTGNWSALLHSGWQGTGILGVALFGLETIFSQEQKNTSVTALAVVFGPSVRADHYPVPEERAALFARRFGVNVTPRLPDGQPALDIRKANLDILADWELSKPGRTVKVEVCEDSTVEHLGLHSYRRDGGSPRYGRMLVLFNTASSQVD